MSLVSTVSAFLRTKKKKERINSIESFDCQKKELQSTKNKAFSAEFFVLSRMSDGFGAPIDYSKLTPETSGNKHYCSLVIDREISSLAKFSADSAVTRWRKDTFFGPAK